VELAATNKCELKGYNYTDEALTLIYWPVGAILKPVA